MNPESSAHSDGRSAASASTPSQVMMFRVEHGRVEDGPNERPSAQTPDQHGRFRQHELTILALVLCGLLAFHGLANHRFWDDEANTAIFARNLNQFGELTAWDGRNLVGFRQGGELDENLVNVYMPPLQYWVAALGLEVFSDPTFGARFPFVVTGLISVLLLAICTRRLFGAAFPWALPALLLAVTPTFLLYIRNCRYYGLGVMFTLGVLVVCLGRPRTGGVRAIEFTVGILSTVGLWLSHYINAAVLFATLPLLLFLPECRQRGRLKLVATLYLTSGLVGLWIYVGANPFDAGVAIPDPTPFLEKMLTRCGWHLKGLATFEFVPVLLAPVLACPFFVRRLTGVRPIASRGLLVVAFVVVASIVTAVISPQRVDIPPYARIADMRQQVPTIAFGAVFASASLLVLWKASRIGAVSAALLLVFSNVLHLGFLRESLPNFDRRYVTCTLGDYVYENFNDYPTGTDALVGFLNTLPRDTVIYVAPQYMGFSPMFYVPEVLFACQLADGFQVVPGIELPDYLFKRKAQVDYVVLRWQVGHAPREVVAGPDDEHWPAGSYTLVGTLPVYALDRTRPELPWHSFSVDDLRHVSLVRHHIYENVLHAQ